MHLARDTVEAVFTAMPQRAGTQILVTHTYVTHSDGVVYGAPYILFKLNAVIG